MKVDGYPTMETIAAAVPAGDIELQADVFLPAGCAGLVVFAHGSGSSRHSPRNRFVGKQLNQAGLGAVLVDLLSVEEEAVDRATGSFRFDIGLLGSRLIAVTDWILNDSRLSRLQTGYFGASTGAAAAIVAAAAKPNAIQAIVSRGGRPDLAGDALPRLRTPALFIVGEEDRTVLNLNRSAMAKLPPETECRLEVIPGATHLFEEPGTLERVAELASSWFVERLGGSRG